MEVEQTLIDIVGSTKQVLTNAGVEFEKSETEIINILNQGMDIGAKLWE